MRVLTAAAAALLACAGAGMASAQTTGQSKTGGTTGAQSMSSQECQQVWNKANPSGKASLSQQEAQQYVKDFKRADSNNDSMLSSAEFTSACGQGNVQQAAAGAGSTGATGAGAGTSGTGTSSGAGTSSGSGTGAGSSQQPSR